MAEEPDAFSSPACALSEADDLYRGFLSPAAIQAHILRWMAAASQPDIATSLAVLLIGNAPTEHEPLPSARSSEPIPTAQLREEINALLPQIRDDRMHEMLKSIAQRL